MQFANKMKRPIFIALLSCLFNLACTHNNTPDVANIKVDLKPTHFEKLVYAIDTNHTMEGLLKLQSKHPAFTDRYTYDLLGWHLLLNKNNDTLQKYLHHFLTYKDFTNLNNSVQQKFADTKKEDAALTQMIQYIKYYLPKYKVPRLYYFNTGLNMYSTITDDSIIGVGLDMYLGKDFEFYPAIQLPKYQLEKCDIKYMPASMARTIFDDLFVFSPEGKDLLSIMIQNGKALFFIDKVLPQTADEIKIGYSKEHLAWCSKNEAMAYNMLIENKLLFETDLQKTMRYVLEGPSSQGLPSECPGNIGSYLGWQIVKKYMAKHSEITLEQLCTMPIDANKILEESGYKPR
jgi:hypothetical protein